ncbi:hypothetical protein SODALDRAFT_356976 [Sodiomyces alkalinus F11]|uniref:Uncharacterized protein n=1 Tax=Sodiomyces alkalinus (strain CBS 110278 / VKM F-3762 / F11) TaxID=1314773 RepID=A0A3N2Q2G4_SODAK|nr:hypothetical protein SODALDRAFT_356976 [Sodiomyces alkalinus F11]ROT40954.1 hypothetical protein SODALDRAFT_356976 [Sodiomyces alkalinus F11]
MDWKLKKTDEYQYHSLYATNGHNISGLLSQGCGIATKVTGTGMWQKESNEVQHAHVGT